MSKNQSPYTVYVQKDGETVPVAPGDDLPAGVSVDNPYVSGKKDAPEAESAEEADEAPKATPKKAASGS